MRRRFGCTRRVPRPSATSTPLLAFLAPDVSALTRLESRRSPRRVPGRFSALGPATGHRRPS
eukprot:6315396-Prymnesium_polylepis.1